MRGRAVSISEIDDRWLALDHHCLKMRSGDGGTYFPRHDTAFQIWQLVMYVRGSPPH